ncbi:MAG: hypothetical protein NZ581_07000 [Candidatus Caldarchaeum sp.]|nr:hypothetical protein [Candidatus Caldarchaeum sp.]MDW8435925.1 hypothetical protein [Candidatus Caldarchaeum sp.]
MKIEDGCLYPDDRLYVVEHDLWLKPTNSNSMRLGVVPAFLFFVGKPRKVNFRNVCSPVKRNTALAILSTVKTEAVLITPFQLMVKAVNEQAVANPARIAEDPYGEGWLAEVTAMEEFSGLSEAAEAGEKYRVKNSKRGVVCLKTVPDYQITIFGETCEGILTQIGDYMKAHLSVGETVHIVTSDPATEVDMISWAEKTGQQLVDLRRVEKTLHVVFERKI